MTRCSINRSISVSVSTTSQPASMCGSRSGSGSSNAPKASQCLTSIVPILVPRAQYEGHDMPQEPSEAWSPGVGETVRVVRIDILGSVVQIKTGHHDPEF